MRILGKGKTAQAIKEIYPDAIMYDDNDLDNYDKDSLETTVVSPGIPPSNQIVKATKNLISEYDLFKDLMPYSIWISGTNGKTTTTAMMQHLLEEYGSVCGGNIGTPLANLDQEKYIWILETSSFTCHYTNSAKPNIYVLLPISDDHTSWHGSFEEYEKAKLKPLDKLQEGEIAIIPKKYEDYPTNGYKICYECEEDLEESFEIDKDKINFQKPYRIDAMLALAVTKILFDKIDYEKMNSFVQDPHKLEKIVDKKNRLWINDSKATNIDATIAALKNFDNKKVYLILGGDDKGANMQPLFEELKKYDVILFNIGSNATKLQNIAVSNGINSYEVHTIENAVEDINRLFLDSDNVALLSPAAASLDQFNSYAHRGDAFKNKIFSLI